MAFGTSAFDITVTDGTDTWTIGTSVNEQSCYDDYGLYPRDDPTTADISYYLGFVAKRITKLYGSGEGQELSGVTGTIRSGGTGNVTAFDNITFFSAAEQQIDHSKTVSYLRIYITNKTKDWSGILYLYYTDGTSTSLDGSASSIPDFAAYGITVTSTQRNTTDYIDLTPVYSTVHVAKLVFRD